MESPPRCCRERGVPRSILGASHSGSLGNDDACNSPSCLDCGQQQPTIGRDLIWRGGHRQSIENGRGNVQKVSLTALMRHQLEIAKSASSGRSAQTVYGGHEHILRQTMIALRAGSELNEHENPGEATVQVLHGRVTLIAGKASWNGSPGDLMFIPDAPHALDAVEDSVVVLTVAKRP